MGLAFSQPAVAGIRDGEATKQQAAEPAEEPEIEITDDPASYDLGDLSDLNSFD